MRVLFSTSEIYPYVKTGGLGDVCAALPPALSSLGVDVRLLVPGYQSILDHLENAETVMSVPVYFGASDVKLLLGSLGELKAYVLDAPDFYRRSGPYVDEAGLDWEDNHFRFAALCRIAADLCDIDTSWRPDIIHSHDWPGGLVPAYVKFKKGLQPKTVLTLHNIAYQGLFPSHYLSTLGLPPESFSLDGVEFYGKIGYLKAGISYADHITTVSPTYAQEIQNTDQGCGLEGALQSRSERLSGILNGIDTDIWNPETDPHLISNYTSQTLRGRQKNRKALIKEFNLSPPRGKPLFTVVSRFNPQKGLDLLMSAVPLLIEQGGSLIVLGSGDQSIEAGFQKLQTRYPDRIGLALGYNESLAHRLQSGADVTVMPSRSEPCGLVQMYAMRYGSVPLVRHTGGLADTVIDVFKNENPTGFIFQDPTPESLEESITKAFLLFKAGNLWLNMQQRGMKQDFSWTSSARKYASLYKSLAV
jgi:starch synthase